MNSLLLLLLSFGALGAAYFFYGGFLSKKLFRIEPERRTPAHEINDGVDFVPTRRIVLFGHHYTSIAGMTPLVGPAIAVIWGWLPAVLWIVLGSIFIGGVHDFAALIISVRRRGKSIGDITASLVSPGTRLILMFIIFFLLLVVIALFAYIIGLLFTIYPASVAPIWFQVPLALLFGWIIYAGKGRLGLWAGITVVILLLSVWVSSMLSVHYGIQIKFPESMSHYSVGIWIIILLVYVFFASTLPVHRLLQPRDFINSYMLFICIAFVITGVVIARPAMVAPVATLHVPAGTPPLFPMLFVIIACGAVSGFHSLVSSGTTSKQIDTESDARFVGYGGMVAEGALAVVATIAAGAGLGIDQWNQTYATYAGSTTGLAAFIKGSSNLIGEFTGRVLPETLFGPQTAVVFVAVVVICFAATTLDTATRIQRYVVGEIGAAFRIKALGNRYVGTLVAVGTAAILAFSQGWATQTAKYLWEVFGTINQLLAAMVLLIVTVYLKRKGRNIAYTVLPMVFLLIITAWAMVWKVTSLLTPADPSQGLPTKDVSLAVIGISALVLELFVVIFGFKALVTCPKSPVIAGSDTPDG